MFTNNYIFSHLSIHCTFALYPTMLVQAPPVITCIWTSSASSIKEPCWILWKWIQTNALHIERLDKSCLSHWRLPCVAQAVSGALLRGLLQRYWCPKHKLHDDCIKLMVDWWWKWLRTFWGLYKWWHICLGRWWGWTLLSSCATTFWCFMNHSVYLPF
jgi:hypothetical protein